MQNHGFELLIFRPRFKNINFYQNIPKINLFLQKNAKFSDPQNSTVATGRPGGRAFISDT